jgi:hypothetical protein
MTYELSNAKIVRHPQDQFELIEIINKKTGYVYFRAITKPKELSDFQVYKMYQQGDHLAK